MKEFERKIISELLEKSDLKNIVLSDAANNEVVEFTGDGYFLTIKDPMLPKHRLVLHRPDIPRKAGRY